MAHGGARRAALWATCVALGLLAACSSGGSGSDEADDAPSATPDRARVGRAGDRARCPAGHPVRRGQGGAAGAAGVRLRHRARGVVGRGARRGSATSRGSAPTTAAGSAAGSAAVTKPPGPQTFADMAADLDGVIDELGLKRPVVLVAHSLGGMVAATWAEEHLDDLAGLVLVDATPPDYVQTAMDVLPTGSKTGADVRRDLQQLLSAGRNAEQLDGKEAFAEALDFAPIGRRPADRPDPQRQRVRRRPAAARRSGAGLGVDRGSAAVGRAVVAGSGAARRPGRALHPAGAAGGRGRRRPRGGRRRADASSRDRSRWRSRRAACRGGARSRRSGSCRCASASRCCGCAPCRRRRTGRP